MKVQTAGWKPALHGEALLGNVDSHLEMDGHSELVVGERIDTDDFGDVFAGQGIVNVGEGKGDKDAHAGVIGGETGREQNAFFRDVDTDGMIFEMIVAGIGRADADGASDFGAAAGAFDDVFGFREG